MFLGMDDATDDENEPLARPDAEFVLMTGSLRVPEGFGQDSGLGILFC